MTPPSRRRTVPYTVAAAVAVAVAVAVAASRPPSLRPLRLAAARALSLPAALDEVFPGVPWTHVLPSLPPPDKVGGVRAADCGKCHQRHYQEWSQSTHAHAYSDLQFQSELGKPGQPRWLCLNCHLPLADQRDELVESLRGGELSRPVARPNPAFDPALRDEGVTCATCHVRRDERGQSYILGASGDLHPPHPVRVDREALARRCDDCHDQTYRLTSTLVCWFQTGAELRAGPYAGDKGCVDCHLPPVERPLTKLDGALPRAAHRHGFVGGGVPKDNELVAAQEELGYRTALDVGWEVARGEGGGYAVSLRLSNARAGHMLPTGDPERFLLVEAQLLDGGGRVVGSEALRIGQLWAWEPEARQLLDNRLAPREQRVVPLTLRAGVSGKSAFTPSGQRTESPLPPPPGPGPPVRLRVTATHVRLTDENAAWMKRTAAAADPRFAPAIAEIDRRYPASRRLFSDEKPLP